MQARNFRGLARIHPRGYRFSALTPGRIHARKNNVECVSHGRDLPRNTESPLRSTNDRETKSHGHSDGTPAWRSRHTNVSHWKKYGGRRNGRSHRRCAKPWHPGKQNPGIAEATTASQQLSAFPVEVQEEALRVGQEAPEFYALPRRH